MRWFLMYVFVVRHNGIKIYAVGYDVALMVGLVVIDRLCRRVALYLSTRAAVSDAVAARSARLSDAVHEPLFEL